MLLTPLGLSLLLVPALLMAASTYWPHLAGWSVGVFLGGLALAVYDNLYTRQRVQLAVERQVEAKLSLGADNRVQIRVASRSRLAGRLLVKDDPPPEFTTPRRVVTADLAGYATRTLSYFTRPTARGRYRFGNVHVRGRSLLGLTWWQRRFVLPQEVAVYPDLLEVERYDHLARADRLAQVGIRLTHTRGQGQEFESLREYTPDDEFRHIDWKATARRRRPITRQYELERSQTLLLMVDAGRMMSALIGDMAKLDYAVNAALMMAYVATAKDDAVGLITFADTVKAFVPPRKGRQQVGRLAEALYDLQPALVEPDYAAAFGLLYGQARKRALVVCYTDLVDVDASRRLLAHLSVLAPRHLPLLVTLRDSNLVAAARQMPTESFDVYRRALASQVETDRDTALSVLRRRGVMVLDALPEKLTVASVNEYLALKARGRL
jgi:uncharacterized protein (DUF58 family)